MFIPQERWVVGFDPEDVKLLCTVYYGSTILTTEVSNKPAKCPLNARQLEDGSTAYKIYFLSESMTSVCITMFNFYNSGKCQNRYLCYEGSDF